MSERYGSQTFKAAAIQAGPIVRDAPEYFDAQATLNKAVSLINEAGRNGARLIVFPEGWMPCFSYWSLDLSDVSAFRDIWAKYLWSSVEVPGPETEALCAAARNTDSYVVMGINERDRKYRGRMYNSMLYLSPRGEIMGTHRKICNTVNERFFHTPGDGGDNLKTVFKTEIGNIGGSICGEHRQLTLIYNWIMQGIQVHCSLWPGTAGPRAASDTLTRALCNTACTYGVLAAGYVPEKDRPQNFYRNSYFSTPDSFCGGSGIISPYGQYVAGPVYDQEAIVYGDIDLADTDRSLFGGNLVGFYSRWDLLSLNVNQEPYEPIVYRKASGMAPLESDRIIALETQVSQLQQQIAVLCGGDKDKSVGA